MVTAVGTAITDVLGWVGSFITSLTSTTGELKDLLPLFAIGIAISAIMLGEPFTPIVLKFGETLL